MFDSGITVSSFIEELKKEIDVALPIDDSAYISWLNTLHQFLYSGLIRMQKEITVQLPEAAAEAEEFDVGSKYVIDFADIGKNTDEATLNFKDICHIYCGTRQLIRTTPTSSKAFGDCYYTALKPESGSDITKECLGINLTDTDHEEIKILYYIRPKMIESVDNSTVRIPFEFIEMAKAYIRHHAYMISNEFAIAANWIQMFNVQHEHFKEWLGINYPEFGI